MELGYYQKRRFFSEPGRNNDWVYVTKNAPNDPKENPMTSKWGGECSKELRTLPITTADFDNR